MKFHSQLCYFFLWGCLDNQFWR